MGVKLNRPDVTVILNLHNEGVFLKRTLLSLDEAVEFATSKGLSIELVAVLDRPDASTERVLREHDLSHYSRTEVLCVNNGSLGLSRNDGIVAASGEYIMTADGDDLISNNSIFDSFSTAINRSRDTIYFPELLFAFGADYHICIYHPLEEVTPLAFIDMHPYISRVFAHRSIFERLKYNDLRLSAGYAYEDWHFNANAVAHGIDIQIVPNTVLFYRQREGSLLRQANAVSARTIAPSRLFEPTIYTDVCVKFKNENGFQRNNQKQIKPSLKSTIERNNIREYLHDANRIEPSIKISSYNNSNIYNNTQHSLNCGIAYYHACRLLNDLEFDDVFLFPFVAQSGAERYFIEIFKSLYRLSPEKNILLLLGEDFKGPSWKDKFPPNVITLDLRLLHDELSLEGLCNITLKLLQTSCAKSNVHVRQSVFGDTFLRRFGSALNGRDLFYYHFTDQKGLEDERVIIQSSPIDLISENFEHIKHIVTDNQDTAKNDTSRIGLSPDKWKILPVPIILNHGLNRNQSRPLDQILWASRLDTQKRPLLIPKIAQKLVYSENTFGITAYGASVFGQYEPSIFKGYDNLKYMGAFDGFSSLPTNDFGIFLYTSWYDGLPIVILEALANGLLVIAPDVGGISDIIIDNETGFLLPSVKEDKEMVNLYVDAIERATSHPEKTMRMTQNAIELLSRRHSYKNFDEQVQKLFMRKGN